MNRKDRLDVAAVLTLVAVCGYWGYQQVLVKSTLSEVPPLWLASLRFAGAALCLVLWCRLRGVPLLARDGTFWPGVVSGVLFTLQFVFVYGGLTHTTASRLTIFLYVAPFVLALLLPRFVPSERLRTRQWLGLCLAFTALALAFAEGFSDGDVREHLRGDLMGLAGGLVWALTTISLRAPALGNAQPSRVMVYQILVPLVLAPLLSWASGEHWSLDYSARAWFSVGLQTVVGAFVTYLLWLWLLRHYPATLVTSFSFLTPLFALLSGALLLGEPVTPKLLLALAGVAVGMLLVNHRPRA